MAGKSKFDPKKYLAEYCSEKPENDVGEDYTVYVINLIFNQLKPKGKFLEIGGGPSIVNLIAATKYMDNITFTDILAHNLDEIHAWMNGKGFNFGEYTRRLEFENGKSTLYSVLARERLLRQKIKTISVLDAREFDNTLGQYDVLSTHYALECISTSLEEYEKNLKNCLRYLKPGGMIIISAVKNTDEYKVGDVFLPTAHISENDLEDVETGWH